MKTIKAAAVQFCPFPPEQKEKNIDYICSKIKELAEEGYQLITFPELAVTNFFVDGPEAKIKYWDVAEPATNDSMFVSRIAELTRRYNTFVVVGFAEKSSIKMKIYNSAALIGPDGLIGVTRKVHLPTTEKLYFSPAYDIPVFNTPIGKIGIAICADSAVPEYMRILAVKGADIAVMSTSIWKGGKGGGVGTAESKKKLWNILPVMNAIQHQIFIVACNGSGTHYFGEKYGHWERLGMSKIVNPLGQVLARTNRDVDTIVTAELNMDEIIDSRVVYPFLADRVPDAYLPLIDKD